MMLSFLAALAPLPAADELLGLTAPMPGSGPTRHLELARIDENEDLDLVLLRGDELWIAFDFGTQLQFVLASAGVADAAVLPAQAGQSTDRLAVVHGSVLEQVSWSWTPPGLVTEHALQSTLLATIDEVQFAPFNSGPGLLLLGEGRRKAAGSFALGAASAIDFVYEVQGGIDSIAPLEWDGDATDEAILVSQGRLRIYDSTGALELDVAAAGAQDHVVVLPDHAGSRDGVAWLTDSAAPQNTALVTFALGAVEPIQWLGSLTLADAHLADVAGPVGSPDLLLVPRNDGGELIVLEGGEVGPGRPNTFQFGIPEGEPLAFDVPSTEPCPPHGCAGSPGAANGPLCSGDVDGDGDLDLVCAVDSRGELVQGRNGALEYFDRRIGVELDETLLIEPNAGPMAVLPVGFTLFPGPGVAAASSVRVEIFGQATPYDPLAVEPLLVETWPLLWPSTTKTVVLDTGGFTSSGTFQMRLLPQDGVGQPAAEASVIHFALTSQTFDVLAGLPNVGAFQFPVDPETLGGATSRPTLQPVQPSSPTPP